MKQTMKKVVHMIPGALVVALLFAGAVYAATFTQPTQNPPEGNAEQPIHVGSTAQSKAGNFAATALAGTNILAGNAFCLGGADNCITEWPETTIGDFAASCTFERVAVMQPGNYGGPNNDGYQDVCPSNLSAGARSSGWVALGSDACAEDRSDCTTDGVACFYGRFVCDGNFVPASSTKYSVTQAKSNGFYVGNPPAQCSNGYDDDADGQIDYPNDFGCEDPNDNSERSTGEIR